MTRTLSDLVAAGHGPMTITWPDSGESARVGAVAEDAGAHFDDSADAGCVGALMTNDRPTVEVILGAVLAGTRLVSLPLPGRGADIAAYAGFIRDACATFALGEVVVADKYADLVAGTGIAVRRHSELAHRPLAAPAADGFDLIQFTSGSVGPPRPIRVTDVELGANVSAILDTLRPQPGDAVVSWLPLAHDMGLIGMLLTGLAAGGPEWANGGDIVLFDPTTFLRTPTTWLEAIDTWRGSFTAAPDFGFRHVLRRPPARRLDLSSLRCAIVGGEIVRADTLHTFAAALVDHRFDEGALCPAYGMAEAGLAVTMTPPGDHWRSTTVSTAQLADGIVSAAAPHDNTTTLVASGAPLTGYSIDTGCAADKVGGIRVHGPSLGSDGAGGHALADAEGWYDTGDVGFVDDGVLYVCGRTDDYVVAHGRNVYAPALDAAASAVPGVRTGRVTTVNLPSGEWAIVAELEPGAPQDDGARQRVRREIARAAIGVCAARPDTVVFVAPGTLPLTSSGKLQRHRVRAALATGRLQPI